MALSACSSDGSQQRATGYAYAGPTTLNIRSDLELRAETTATLSHGERVEVLETRRRFAKVRTAAGAEGWTDSANLLTQSQMDDIQQLATAAGQLPSQGEGTVFDTLNVHTAPSRPSPTIFQLAEGDSLEVVAHRVTPRNGSTSPAPALDDWFLVRTSNSKAGWVLSRPVFMKIPDEVAQYAERHFIMAYRPLGEVHDKQRDETKRNWLWATSSQLGQPFDFDGFRVFVYSVNRHRYETAYIERNVKGFYPLEVVPSQGEQAFSVVIEDKDGARYKRNYAFSGYRVRMVSKEPYADKSEIPEVRPATTFDSPVPLESSGGFMSRIREAGKRLFGN